VAERVVGVAEDEASLRHLVELCARRSAPPSSFLQWAEPAEEPELHRARICRALDLIRAGELYQVNLARRFSFRLAGSPLGLWQALSERAPAPYAAYVDAGDWLAAGVSPEQLLSLGSDGELATSPIKGTRPRRRDPGADAALARELELDPKERAELAMVIDVERNDLGRVAVTGSVRLSAPPRVHSYAAVHHRVARLSARLRPGLGRADLLAAMLPSGSVTGAPKVRAMEVIALLEAHRRGLYTGGIGLLGHDGSLELGMAIRTVTVHGDEAHYFAGGGIVADSDPDREVEETCWKAAQLLGLVGPAPRSSEHSRKLVRNPLGL
jgi:anthranilate/para-aminobenzoate synthase component I